MASPDGQTGNLRMRAEQDVMALSRLGCHYPTRLSFSRVLTRTLLHDQWQITQTDFNLDHDGVGEIVYTVRAPGGLYTFVVFSHDLDPDQRTDRVIAESWDMTAVLCAGEVDSGHLGHLRENVPLQEKGRLDGRALVMTRGNRSSRNFTYVVDCLAQGTQPGLEAIARVGYLYRTTAVYGSGKFGMCDWKKVKAQFCDFNRPFAAEMFTCFMLRQASFDIVEHLAKKRAPEVAVTLNPDIKRYIGIGNATGLGMAPFLVCHPQLINQWIECRELALARVRTHGTVDKPHLATLSTLLKRAQQHLGEIALNNAHQNAINERTITELNLLAIRVAEYSEQSWENLLESTATQSMDTQEILVACLIELQPELVDDLADFMSTDEQFDIQPEQSLTSLKRLLESRYDWALNIDFGNSDSRRMFWYRSVEKMEPRLGEIDVDTGVDKQMHVDIARQASELYEYICDHLHRHPNDRVAHFLISLPALRYIVRRVQTMAHSSYGEIRANLLDVNIEPTWLMRCKLSFFGVSKFDPQSRLWVRNTMFQGAPTVDDLPHSAPLRASTTPVSVAKRLDDWSFPVIPGA